MSVGCAPRRTVASWLPDAVVVMAHRAIGPAGDEERFAIGMEENAVGPAAGLDALDQHAGLRIDHHHRIVIQIRGVEQVAVRRERHVADEILTACAFRAARR